MKNFMYLSHPMFWGTNSYKMFKIIFVNLEYTLPSFRWLNQTAIIYSFSWTKKSKQNPDSKEHQLYLFFSELQYCSLPRNRFLLEKIVPEGTFTCKYSGQHSDLKWQEMQSEHASESKVIPDPCSVGSGSKRSIRSAIRNWVG